MCREIQLDARRLKIKFLSYNTRMVILKAIFQAITIYMLSIFLVPKSIISSITISIRNFEWYDMRDHFKYPLVSWKDICKYKKNGRLSLKELISSTKLFWLSWFGSPYEIKMLLISILLDASINLVTTHYPSLGGGILLKAQLCRRG